MITKNEAIKEINYYQSTLVCRGQDGEREAATICRDIIERVLPNEAFMISDNIESYGRFTKNGRFIISIANMTKYSFEINTTEGDIILICNHFKNICGGRRIKSKERLSHDYFIFSKKYSQLLKNYKK